MTIKDALRNAVTAHVGARPLLECEILLGSILHRDRVFLHSHSDYDISNHDFELLLSNVNKLNRGYPIEYITNIVSFYSHNFYIDSRALIPRPETELLVTHVSELIQEYDIKRIFEIGVGSGVISIVLCLLNKDLEIIATDISQDALEVASINVKSKSNLDNTLIDRISLVNTNLLDGLNFSEHDFIVSNPPYISNSYKLPVNVSFEPKSALFAGENGDDILKKIIGLNARFICCEVGHNHEYLKDYLHNYRDIRFYRDYSNLPRGFLAIK